VTRNRSREPTSLELALWRHAVRDVEPLTPAPPQEPSRAEPPHASPTPPGGPGSLAARLLNGAAKQGPATAAGQSAKPVPRPAPENLDRRTWQRLQRGQYAISARLDLHGLSQSEAHDRLIGFIGAQHGRGARCVLVITGRGLRSGGVLRSQTPRWLSTPPLAEKVLAYAPARVGHGGEGALYVLLRRTRQPAKLATNRG
jgi:DNA-nicking Smr family endonuclease